MLRDGFAVSVGCSTGCRLSEKIRAGLHSGRELERWTGQMGYAATVDPTCRVELQALRSQIGTLGLKSSKKRRIHMGGYAP
eukprot:COSAG01_NODE_18226_length_1091_cov_1.657258_1_plen_81_part_00